jgi:diaminopimelate decarboxylase
MHIGSQILDPNPTGRASSASSSWWAGAGRRCRYPSAPRHRGRLGIRYRDETPLLPDRFARHSAAGRAVPVSPSCVEPGRFLVGSAGVLLTTVLSRKHSGGKELVLVDAGMNDLVRPSHYQAYHEIG